jgi:acyl-CoA thioester hydrolase
MEDAQITYRGTVYPWHCDHVGHMNVMWYVGKFDEATWNLFQSAGLTPAALRDAQRGMVAVDQHIAYQRELHAGDTVTVRSDILEVGEKKLRFRHEMRNNATGEVAAVTTLLGVHLDLQTRRACAFAPEVLARLRAAAGAAVAG